MEEERTGWRRLKVAEGGLLKGDGLSLACVSLYQGSSSVSGSKGAQTNNARFMVKNKENVLLQAASYFRSRSCK